MRCKEPKHGFLKRVRLRILNEIRERTLQFRFIDDHRALESIEPRMSQRIHRANSFRWITLQQLKNQILRVVTNRFPARILKRALEFLHLLQNIRLRFPTNRRRTLNEREQHHAETP